MSSKVLATSHKQSYRPPRLVERVADDLDVELREVGPVATEVLLRVAGCAAGSRRVSGRAQHKRVVRRRHNSIRITQMSNILRSEGAKANRNRHILRSTSHSPHTEPARVRSATTENSKLFL